MKIFVGLLVAALALNGVLALPAGTPSDDAEVIDVGRTPARYPARRVDDVEEDDDGGFRNFKGVVDTGVGYPFLQPNPNAFSFNLGFFDSFEDIFRRLRTRLWNTDLTGGADSDESSGESNFPLSFDTKNGNTTSTVKVVDGHKVEVNETVYGGNNNVFRVRVVNIRPLASGEEVEETVLTSDADKSNPNPVTSAPTRNNNNEANESGERREPLEKNPAQNEVHDIDEPEHEQYNTMLPTTTTTEPTTNENNAANLNAAFVTDNSLEESTEPEPESEQQRDDANGSGNIEAETNKPDDDIESGSDMENYDATAASVEALEEDAASSLLASERLTIESNEETEVNDNLNESAAPVEDDAEQLTKELSELELSAAAAAEKGAEQQDKVHSNKQRENFYSSDDDSDTEEPEMTAGFNSEWADLADELTNANDRNNELSNDIDAYDVVPVDLSNDIAVNEWAAAQPGYPHNPDAEVVDVEGVLLAQPSMPKFEKLSVAAARNPTSYQPTPYAQNMK